jgi:hypothetical protein
MSAFADALAAIRTVLLMQSNVERLEKNVDQLGRDQAGFRDALFALDRRLIRVETILEGPEIVTCRAQRLLEE